MEDYLPLGGIKQLAYGKCTVFCGDAYADVLHSVEAIAKTSLLACRLGERLAGIGYGMISSRMETSSDVRSWCQNGKLSDG